ncbi:TlpA family protein disulfide reductase [Agrobacterium genomosp. 3]|uniref:TlpA family protein disulfide reductase n=1 Tax=Agrobacterium tumefaciens TaxID=358 RepID=A0AAE6BTR7_AGRTU|nr:MULTISPECIES: TlpA disulfide reductase family protein [Agrobacterium tumefaciens complex]MCA1869427.1 TlpA family protein disulfide reductase [Agrobacterium tomkonis]MCA2378816.1 TlpA family protein disulfide reductase [Agrobacterium tomkonis RTP8]MCA1879806.1 TlpA family protein disulfide reductase [Agrobacterium tumefaciens]MCA1895003.1 TlpA family protein disulfide reductase [Agrobacterium tomkonis]MCA2371077.1 TlpA family protein disulfide reductase [Agrobacterium tomkonis CIP 111-78]
MRPLLLTVIAIAVLVSPATAGPPKAFVFRDTRMPVPALQFTDGAGRPETLEMFRGKVVLFNVWATWCLPCRKEMPTLDRLQATLGGADFEVVALSIDRSGPEAVKTFYAETGIQHLAIHVDATSKAGFALASFGLPTTLLVDRQGQELGRLVGPVEWDAPDMIAFLKSTIETEPVTQATPRNGQDQEKP